MIITLCGSARFEDHFKLYNEVLSLAGHTVFSLAVYPSDKDCNKNWYTDSEKRVLDLVHLNKIRSSDAVVFINVLGYWGSSTLTELEYAKMLGKDLYVLESWGKGCGPYKSKISSTSNEGFQIVSFSQLLGSGYRRSRLIDKIEKFKSKTETWSNDWHDERLSVVDALDVPNYYDGEGC